MKTSFLLPIIILLFSVALNSCSLLGIHFKDHNPTKPGKPPKFSKESVLLGELSEKRECYDVHYYDLDLKIKPNQKSLVGTVQVHAIAVQDFDIIQLDLHPNFNIKSLRSLNNNSNLTFTREERAVFVNFSAEKGENFKLEIEYSGKPMKAKRPPWKGGFVWKKSNKKPWVGVACESDGASIWWPLKDHTSDEPDSMRLHYKVPSGLVAIGNGQLENISKTDSIDTYNWLISYPINTYNVSIYVGDFVNFSEKYDGLDGPMSLDYYVMPRNLEKAKEHFKQVHQILNLYEKRFGPYPWYRDGFKLIESPYAGMEHQSAIAYGDGYKNKADKDTDYIILHEAAHEWWGNSITAKDLADVWLQEGFATYSEALYLEDKSGKSAYDLHMLIYRWLIKNKYPVIGIEGRRWFHFRKNADVYMKGAWILHTFRRVLEDDELFFNTIKGFYNKYQKQIITSQDFIEYVNEATDEDYSWFFDNYLKNNYVPEFQFSIDMNGTLYYRWDKVPDNFNQLRLDIYSNEKEFTIYPSKTIQTIQLPKSAGGLAWTFAIQNEYLIAVKKKNSLKFEK